MPIFVEASGDFMMVKCTCVSVCVRVCVRVRVW